MDYVIEDNASPVQTSTERTQKWRKETGGEYLSRLFVPVDGEGVNVRSGKRKGEHDYVLLTIHNVEPIVNKIGLTSMECFTYLWENLSPKNLNIIYGGSYDFNCWLRDLPPALLAQIYAGERKAGIRYGPFRITWRRGKYFRIARLGKSVTIYDIVSFFQKSFVEACDEYLGDYAGRDTLVREKARRGDFTLRQLRQTTAYNNLELNLLKQLADELRLRLDKVGLRPQSWIGPGAVAAALFTREGVPDHMAECPTEVNAAAQYAYAGGRFECVKHGIGGAPAWEYDINSAYPKALSLVPSLKDGTWKHVKRVKNIADFAVYRVRWQSTDPGRDATRPGPFFVRAKDGTISYPLRGENWVWSPEVALIPKWEQETGFRFTILEGWVFTPSTGHRPFGFVPALYERRKVLKAARDGAHVGIKLALNSMYGKTAQQVGWNKQTRKPPRYHQLEWAGFVTSWCRAKIAEAALQDLDAVIAFETDALFTSRPLVLPVSDRLGEWKETRFLNLTYIQSGHYYGDAIGKHGVEAVRKGRGIEKGTLRREDVEALMTLPLESRELPVTLTRFITLGAAINVGLDKWRRWLTGERVMHLFPMGKRSPVSPVFREGWQETICPLPGGVSERYPLEWLDDAPEEMAEYRFLRESDGVGWD